ncbi:multiple cyclophane-containing RiPP AmcA [Streptomyces thermolilacinus]
MSAKTPVDATALVLDSASGFATLLKSAGTKPLAAFDNRPTWDNPTPVFDNRPSWDNWKNK